MNFLRERINKARFFSIRTTLALGLLSLAFLVGGCADIRHVVGRPFDVSALEETLVVGESGGAEVRAALGPPDGVGRYLSPTASEPMIMWSYNYEHGTLPKRLDRNLLFVFFRESRYAGYLWFSDGLTSVGG